VFTPLSLAAFLAWAFFSEVVGTMAGFGAATVLTPVAAHFMDMRTAVAVVAFFHICGNASRVHLFWRNVDWGLFARFGVASVLFTLGGAWLSGRMPSEALRAVFGGFLVVYAGLSLLGARLSLPARPATAAWGGVLSGFVAGLIGTGGAIRSAFLMAFGQPKERYIATSAMIALVIDGMRLPVYAAQGYLSREVFWPLAGLLVIANLGARTGKRLVSRIPQAKFTLFVLWVLLLMGIKMLWDGLSGF
jgi:uncharacterized protein